MRSPGLIHLAWQHKSEGTRRNNWEDSSWSWAAWVGSVSFDASWVISRDTSSFHAENENDQLVGLFTGKLDNGDPTGSHRAPPPLYTSLSYMIYDGTCSKRPCSLPCQLSDRSSDSWTKAPSTQANHRSGLDTQWLSGLPEQHNSARTSGWHCGLKLTNDVPCSMDGESVPSIGDKEGG